MAKISFELDNRPERFFETAQEAWMWFCYCESNPKIPKDNSTGFGYPCEPSDIAIVVKKLFLGKQLTKQHIRILEKYGLKQLPPHEKSGDPIWVCQMWKQALEKILKPLRIKGIVGLCGRAFAF